VAVGPAPTVADRIEPITVVLSTHFDDAVLSCYSAFGAATVVVTVLGGVPPRGVLGDWDAGGGATDSHERIRERREEDARALSLSGSQFVHLDFPEGQQWGQAGIAVPTLDELEAGLRPHLDTADSVFAPAGIWNDEHKLIRDAALRVRPDATLYADLPYALHPATGGFELPSEVPGEGRQRREVQLAAETAAAKVEACLCYETQLRQLRDIFGSFLNPEMLGREVFWDFQPSR
jgi:hypothetical protein